MASKQRKMQRKPVVWISLAALVFISLLLFALKNIFLADIRDVKVSNVSLTSATVTWVTDEKTPGIILIKEKGEYTNTFIDLFSSNRYYDARDVNDNGTRTVVNLTNRYTHYVTIENLKPGKDYEFRVSNGLKVWDAENSDQKSEWYAIKNVSEFKFETDSSTSERLVLPQTIYGDLQDQKDTAYDDGLVFIQLYSKGAAGINLDNPSEIISTYVNPQGSWVLDYSSLLGDDSTNKEAYIFAHIEDKNDIPGQFEQLKGGNVKVELFKYDRLQSLSEKFKIPFASEVKAAGPSFCCALVISGRKNVLFDYENDAPCSSCGACFPVGASAAGGTIEEVGEVEVSGSSDSEKRNNCESMVRAASEGVPSGSTSGGNSGNFGGTCNANLKDEDFELDEIDRDQFISYANRLAGDGSQADTCYNYVVCKARQNGINPAMMLNIWVHESAASNYKRFPGVEDMGIHCYAGAGDYPAYGCNQTPKEDIKAQTEMFGLLPHTKCLTGGFDIVKWSTGFWTGDCTDTSYGEKYYTDLKLQWSSYGKGPFPTWMKNPSSAQPNLDCDTDGAAPPPGSGTNNGSNNGSNNGNNNGSNNGSNNGNNNGSNNPGSIPTTPSSGTKKERCCAVLVEGSDKFSANLVNSTSCEAAQPQGSNFEGFENKGKVQYGVEITEYEIGKEAKPLCCAIQYSGKDSIYFDYENDGVCNKCGECFPVGKKVGEFTVEAVGSVDTVGSTDAEMRANCEAMSRPLSAGVPADTHEGTYMKNNCNDRTFEVVCENGLPTPINRKTGSPYGVNTRCINPNDTPKDDGIINIAISKTNSNVFTKLIGNAYAAESKVEEVSGSIIRFTEDGIYNIEIGDYKISNVPINSDAKYRFYENKNDTRGYQDKADIPVAPKDKNAIKAVKVEDAFRLELNSGYNFVAVNYKRDPSSIVNSPANTTDITSEAMLNIGNIDEIKVTYITTFSDGKWVAGVRPRDDRKPGLVGNSFPVKPSNGYVIVSNSDMKGAMALILPGKKVDTKVATNLIQGWNFVGFTGKIEPDSAVKYVEAEVSTNKLTKMNLTRWDTQKGLFEGVQSVSGQVYGNDYKLNNNLGYFIYTDKAFKLK